MDPLGTSGDVRAQRGRLRHGHPSLQHRFRLFAVAPTDEGALCFRRLVDFFLRRGENHGRIHRERKPHPDAVCPLDPNGTSGDVQSQRRRLRNAQPVLWLRFHLFAAAPADKGTLCLRRLVDLFHWRNEHHGRIHRERKPHPDAIRPLDPLGASGDLRSQRRCLRHGQQSFRNRKNIQAIAEGDPRGLCLRRLVHRRLRRGQTLRSQHRDHGGHADSVCLLDLGGATGGIRRKRGDMSHRQPCLCRRGNVCVVSGSRARGLCVHRVAEPGGKRSGWNERRVRTALSDVASSMVAMLVDQRRSLRDGDDSDKRGRHHCHPRRIPGVSCHAHRNQCLFRL